MIKVEEYKGYIRNGRDLCSRLQIDFNLPRKEREEQILIKGYEVWRDQLPLHLDGMFAAALWDEEKKKLFCMRDPFGTKSFYYYRTEDGQLLYGSSIRHIMAQAGFIKKLNEDALQLYLNMTYMPGEDTFFEGVKKLMPGHYLIWEDRKLEITCYFKPEFHPQEGRSLQEWADEIHEAVQEAVAENEEDGAAVFLSGGVDSAYILAVSKVQMSRSCGYEEKEYDEAVTAAQVAQVLGRENSRCIISPDLYFAAVPNVMYEMEQPLGDASAIVFAIACREAAKQVKVCYSGEGADEFFGGYHIYQKAEAYGDKLEHFYVGNTNIMREEEKQKILKRYHQTVQPLNLMRLIYEDTKKQDPLSKMMMIDIQLWLEGAIYLNIDKMSTAAGLEIRMPFTNRRLFDIASRLPSKYKAGDGQNKLAFRTAAAKVLPQETAFRKKLGFAVPIRSWLADEQYNQDVRKKFKGEIAAKFFHLDALEAILEDFLGGNSQTWRKVWTIYTFLVWYEEYFIKR